MFDPKLAKTFSKILEKFEGKQVVVIGHMRPDGDCIGSQVALVRCLKTLGFDAIAVNNDPVTDVLNPFVEDTPFVEAKDFRPKSEAIAITVDCGSYDRIGKRLSTYFPEIELCIDHHISNPLFGKENIVLPEATSTAEILANIFYQNGYDLDKITATSLYLGLVSDTGQFRFASTTKESFLLAARLVESGAKPDYVSHYLYFCEAPERMELLKLYLNTFKFELGGKLATAFVTDEMYKKTGATRQLTEGFVDYTRKTQGVLIGAFLEELKGNIKVSLRGVDDFCRVDQLAAQFGGGGHVCAAGFDLPETKLSDFYPKFLKTVEEHLQSVEKS